ncbi:MAG: S9 family peptidase [candidate division KSB1 bacterium]|nr:S9 family peptidase [candidate division KSB1 bacterium]
MMQLRKKACRACFLWAVVLAALAATSCAKKPQPQVPEPPRAEKIPTTLVHHGHERVDNYYWLNQRDNPKVIAYLEAENRYLEAALAHTEKLQNKLYKEILGRIKQTDMSVPYIDNGYYYYTRFEKGKEYPVYARKKGQLSAPEEVMLDVNAMAIGHPFYSVTGVAVSPDNRWVAFGVDTVSRRRYTIYFKDLLTGETLAEAIPNTTGQAVWANDNKTVFYVSKDTTTLRPERVFRHVLGTSPAEDVEVYHEKDSTFSVYAHKSKSRQYVFLVCASTLSSEVRFLDADNPAGSFAVVQPRERNHEYSVAHVGDKFYIVTNFQAKNFRLMETDVATPGKAHWREVVPHRDDVLLEDVEVSNDYLVVSERKNGLRQLRIISQADKSEHYLDFGEEAYYTQPTDNMEMDTHVLRYSYTSLTTPLTIYDYDMVARTKTLLKRQEVLGGFRQDNYQTERLYAPANDGTLIPISLVHRKGMVKDGSHPLLLYGYGSYGASMEAAFSSPVLSLLDRGFIYAIAHIRGGSEMGRQWYEDGKLLKKKNTFTDFINCAEYLVREKYTSPDRLFARGGSAGGLLMGAVVNMRPDLFKGVIANVPWVDVVTTMLDESIPLTSSEYDEWGNPHVKEYYDYMLSYSPYDNVTAQAYPALFVTTGLHDSQVQYFEPAKWVAKLRELKTDSNLQVLHTDMHSGHGGASGRFERFKRTAMEYAFLLDQVGIRE